MPAKVVEVPGVGNIEFPDGMSDADIGAAIAKQKGGDVPKPAYVQPAGSGAGRAASGLWDTTVGGIGGMLKTAYHMASSVARGAPSPEALQDIENLALSHADQFQKMQESWSKPGAANKIEAVGHGMAAALPLIGPAAAHAGERIGGTQPKFDRFGNVIESGKAPDLAGGLGESVGLVGSAAAPAAAALVKNAPKAAPGIPGGPGLAERMYQGALNPRINTPPAEVRSMVSTGLENSIPVNEAGSAKLNTLLADLNRQLQAKIDPHAAAGGAVDPWSVANRVDDVTKRARVQVNPERDLKDIAASQDEFLRNNQTPIPADRAQAMKVGTYQKLNGKYGDVASDATIEAQKALARGIKEELNAQLPELAGLNAHEAKLFDLQGPLEQAVAKAANRQGKGIGIGAAVTGGVVGELAGSGVMGLGAGLLKHVLADPSVRSRLAIAINKAQQANPGQYGKASMAAATARVAQLAAAMESSQDQK